MISLREIDENNYRDILKLRVSKDQTKFVLSNSNILARAYAFRKYNSRVLGIYNEDTGLGCLLLRDYIDDCKYLVIDQLMIDEKYQKLGYAKKALNILLESNFIKEYDKITVCYIDENLDSYELFSRLGFKRIVEKDDGDELVMELIIKGGTYE